MKKLYPKKREDDTPPTPKRLNRVELKEQHNESKAKIMNIIEKDFRASLTWLKSSI